MIKQRSVRIFLAILFVCFIAGCDPFKKLTEINFDETVDLPAADISKKPKINICIGSMITPEEGYSYYKKLLDYIGEKTDMSINFIERRTYAEVNALLENGSIDVAFVCGGPYVVGHDEFGLELLAAPLIGGKAVYYSYIIAAKNSGIEKFEDLKGGTFAFADPMSNTGKLIPAFMLHKMGQSPKSFFKESSYTFSHDRSIKAVAQGIVNGAAVDSLIWEYMNKKNPQYTQKTRIIRVSEPYGIPPVVVRPGLESGLKAKLKNVLLNVHKDKAGKQILEGMLIDRFVEIDDSNYDSIRTIRKTLLK
jgi:phosphonate transport system substrate-binding protein